MEIIYVNIVYDATKMIFAQNTDCLKPGIDEFLDKLYVTDAILLDDPLYRAIAFKSVRRKS